MNYRLLLSHFPMAKTDGRPSKITNVIPLVNPKVPTLKQTCFLSQMPIELLSRSYSGGMLWVGYATKNRSTLSKGVPHMRRLHFGAGAPI